VTTINAKEENAENPVKSRQKNLNFKDEEND
jgi:hypothetical protein